jgi:hypothetical protein
MFVSSRYYQRDLTCYNLCIMAISIHNRRFTGQKAIFSCATFCAQPYFGWLRQLELDARWCAQKVAHENPSFWRPRQPLVRRSAFQPVSPTNNIAKAGNSNTRYKSNLSPASHVQFSRYKLYFFVINIH